MGVIFSSITTIGIATSTQNARAASPRAAWWCVRVLRVFADRDSRRHAERYTSGYAHWRFAIACCCDGPEMVAKRPSPIACHASGATSRRTTHDAVVVPVLHHPPPPHFRFAPGLSSWRYRHPHIWHESTSEARARARATPNSSGSIRWTGGDDERRTRCAAPAECRARARACAGVGLRDFMTWFGDVRACGAGRGCVPVW